MGEIRGVSGFVLLDEIVGGILSVMLSFVVEFDVESCSVEKFLMERKKGISVGIVVEKGGVFNWNCGFKI